MSIVPSGRRKDQVRQGPYQNDSIFGSDLFEKIAITGRMDLGEMDQQTAAPSSEMQGILNGGGLDHDGQADRQDMDRMPPDAAMQDQQPGITPASPTEPVKAVPSDSLMQGEENIADQPTFWENLANQLSPFLQERNLRIVGNPKMTDRNENIYELLLGPMIDPRTRQPMELPPTTTSQLFADAKQIAGSSGGIIKGLPFVDESQVWHIPLQIGGGSSHKLVSKPGNRR